MPTQRKFGWRPPIPRPVPATYRLSLPPADAALPSLVDFRVGGGVPEVYDQGEFGSCTGNATAGAVHYLDFKDFPCDGPPPSRLFDYALARNKEGTLGLDAGASIQDVIEAVNLFGIPPEAAWPYTDSNLLAYPSADALQAASLHKSIASERVIQSVDVIRAVLARWLPVVFGVTVYESFESDAVARSGMVPVPNPEWEHMVGGHAMVMFGYSDADKVFIVRNSYGTAWGDKGYCYFPYDYVQQGSLWGEAWAIDKMT